MASLYEISNDILKFFSILESTDGELTEDIIDSLEVKQEELKEKLNNYYKAVLTFKADADFCKCEKKRIDDTKKKFDNRVERLKKAMLEAVLAFGEQGKGGNRFIELPTVRLFTRESTSICIDEDRIKIFMSEFERYIRELVSQGILYAGIDVDLQGILDCINANVKAEQGEDFEPFTMSDLTTLEITVKQSGTIYDLFKRGNALNLYGNEPLDTTLEYNTPKDNWKTIINVAENTGISFPTIARQETNYNLQIK